MLPEDARPATTDTFKMGSCTACGVVHILGDFCDPDHLANTAVSFFTR